MSDLDIASSGDSSRFLPHSSVSDTLQLGSVPGHIRSTKENSKDWEPVDFAGELRFSPDPRLVLRWDPGRVGGREILREMFGAGEKQFRIAGEPRPMDYIRTGAGELTPRREPINLMPASADLTAAYLHLFNFPQFFVQAAAPETPVRRSVDLRGNGWRARITHRELTREALDRFENRGGYLLTHEVTVTRDDGKPFSSDDLVGFIDCLQTFLSFATGRAPGLALPRAVNSSGDVAFAQWGFPVTHAGVWRPSLTWFDALNAGALEGVFQGFSVLWNREPWSESLRRVIYWYIRANGTGPSIGTDSGLILAQTALELLAWNHCVIDRGLVSKDAFEPRGLSAADKLRLTGASMGIPLVIPTELASIATRPGASLKDVPEAIVTVRNGLVHPKEAPSIKSEVLNQTWTLAMWYTEMMVLRLCGYQGTYACRFKERWSGQVEPVPWAV